MIKLFTEEEYKQTKYSEELPLRCDICEKEFLRKKSIFYSGERKGYKFHVCSKECQNKRQTTSVEIPCKQCGKKIKKQTRYFKYTRNSFCSHSCAATYNNTKYPKRNANETKARICPVCEGKKDPKAKRCHFCKVKENFANNMEKPMDVLLLDKSPSRAKYSQIRRLAKQYLELENIPKKCDKCDFDIAVHVCHIKPLHTFSRKTLIKEVNSLSNLVYLCPNHHAMQHKGLLDY